MADGGGAARPGRAHRKLVRHLESVLARPTHVSAPWVCLMVARGLGTGRFLFFETSPPRAASVAGRAPVPPCAVPAAAHRGLFGGEKVQGSERSGAERSRAEPMNYCAAARRAYLVVPEIGVLNGFWRYGRTAQSIWR